MSLDIFRNVPSTAPFQAQSPVPAQSSMRDVPVVNQNQSSARGLATHPSFDPDMPNPWSDYEEEFNDQLLRDAFLIQRPLRQGEEWTEEKEAEFQAWMSTTGFKFVSYFNEFANGDIELQLMVATEALTGACIESISDEDPDKSLRDLKMHLRSLIPTSRVSRNEPPPTAFTSTLVTSDDQFNLLWPLINNARSQQMHTKILIARAFLNGLANSLTGANKTVVQALSSSDGFLALALSDGPLNWVLDRGSGYPEVILPMTIMARVMELRFANKVDSYAVSAFVPFCIALNLYVALTARIVPEDRTPRLIQTIQSLDGRLRDAQEYIESISQSPEVQEAQRREEEAQMLEERRGAVTQMIQNAGLEGYLASILWALLTKASTTRIQLPFDILERYNNKETIQWTFRSGEINPIADVLNAFNNETSTKIVTYVGKANDLARQAQESELAHLEPWQALIIDVGADDGSVELADVREITRESDDSMKTSCAYVDDVCARAIVIVVNIPEDWIHEGIKTAPAQLMSVCLLRAVAMAFNVLDENGQMDAGVLELVKRVLKMTFVQLSVPSFDDLEGAPVVCFYIAFPVFVSAMMIERIKAAATECMKQFVSSEMEVGASFLAESIGFIPTYTACMGLNLEQDLTRLAIAFMTEDNVLTGYKDSRDDITGMLDSMLEMATQETEALKSALDDGTVEYTDRLTVNAGIEFSGIATSTGDVKEFAHAILKRISMMQCISVPPVRTPPALFAPMVIASTMIADGIEAQERGVNIEALPPVGHVTVEGIPFDDVDRSISL